MSPQEVRKLVTAFNSSEIRHKRRWYLLAEDGQSWTPVGGPYETRETARNAKRAAFEKWQALSPDVRWSYLTEVAA